MCLACFPHDRKHPFLRVLGQVRVWEAVRDASTGIALEDDGNDVQARLTEDQFPCLMGHRQWGLWMWEEASAAFSQFSCEPKAVLNNNVN